MFYFNAKRQRVIASFFSLSLSFVLIVSCASDRPIVIDDIRTLASALIEYIDTTEKYFSQTSISVNTSYGELKENLSSESFIVDPEFSNLTIQKMEARHLDLSTQHKELDNSIKRTNAAANKLFSTLETRARQNTRADLQEESLRGIRATKKNFTDRIEVAEDVSSKLQLAIKEYDNILNFLQVTTVTQEARKYITTVDSVISQYETLNQEVQVALNEGRQVIANIPGVNSQTPESSVPIPTANENTAQLPSTSNVTSPQPVTIEIAKDNQTQEQANRPFLGIKGIGLTQARQQTEPDKNLADLLLNLDNLNQGVLVVEVFQNSSAAEAGITVGDVILMLNGQDVTDISEITAELGKFQVGAESPLVVHRNQQSVEVSVRFKANPNISN